jgi:hypothetical protein
MQRNQCDLQSNVILSHKKRFSDKAINIDDNWGDQRCRDIQQVVL